MESTHDERKDQIEKMVNSVSWPKEYCIRCGSSGTGLFHQKKPEQVKVTDIKLGVKYTVTLNATPETWICSGCRTKVEKKEREKHEKDQKTLPMILGSLALVFIAANLGIEYGLGFYPWSWCFLACFIYPLAFFIGAAAVRFSKFEEPDAHKAYYSVNLAEAFEILTQEGTREPPSQRMKLFSFSSPAYRVKFEEENPEMKNHIK
jgi:hypothetical protein